MKNIIIITAATVLAGVIASVQIQRRTNARLADGESELRQQARRIAELKDGNKRLSDSVTAGMAASRNSKRAEPPGSDRAEVAELRAKIEALRQQTNELEQLREQLAEQRRLEGTRSYTTGDSNLLNYSRGRRVSFPGGPREPGKLNDARALAAAIRKYATENEGRFPVALAEVERYLPESLKEDSPPWANAPPSGTNEFEIVFHGSLNDLTNIPLRRVALIRERQPWQNEEGKWMRVYGWADGSSELVESEDDFASWDAQHIIPANEGR